MIYLHLKAKNDRNGGVVGAFIVICNNGVVVETIKEHGDGDHVQAKYPNVFKGPTIETTSTVIKQFLKHFEATRTAKQPQPEKIAVGRR